MKAEGGNGTIMFLPKLTPFTYPPTTPAAYVLAV
jgi:hypothetical protein